MAKTLTGIVSSNKTDKTIVVTTHTRKTHPVYKKQYMVTSKFMAHDPKNEAQVGDRVSIIETRPISAKKRYILKTILERSVISENETVEAIESSQTSIIPEKIKQPVKLDSSKTDENTTDDKPIKESQK